MAVNRDDPAIFRVDPAAADLFPEILALNNAHARQLSWVEPAQFRQMAAQAFIFNAIGQADAFLLAFDQTADYASPNFLWFRDRHQRFVYVDRVAVAAMARGRGYARRLYEDLFRLALAAGHDKIACEVNTNPPNLASDAFHNVLGFAQVGAAAIGGGKTVRYCLRQLA